MNAINYDAIRNGLGSLDVAAAHTASGEDRARVEDIFAPAQHAGALDPNVTIVLGARGAGKSFWASVLGNEDTRSAAAEAYPNLGLDKLEVGFGFTGQLSDGSVSKETIDRQVPKGSEDERGILLWRCVVLRSVRKALDGDSVLPIKKMMERFEDPESLEDAMLAADRELSKKRQKFVVIFDALDGLATDWDRLTRLTDALLAVAWSLRGYENLRVKLFFRPDQIRDLNLRFVEVPKLFSGATNLRWDGVDLYGMLFVRMARLDIPGFQQAFQDFLNAEKIPPIPASLKKLRAWPLASDHEVQAQIFTKMAGAFMGKSNKKGKTYEWPLRHLADGHDEVTPRSFLTLMISAATHRPFPMNQVISAEGIRQGLREASKVRVDQLAVEFPWIRRALAPLALLQVPCEPEIIVEKWRYTQTTEAIKRHANKGEFLSPFEKNKKQPELQLITSLVRIGVLSKRQDDRYDMPDLFRVAARLLKKGGVSPV